MTSRPSAPWSAAWRARSSVSGKFDVPGLIRKFIPSLFLSAVSVTSLRSATEKEGNSPVVPRTTMPSAPLCWNHARMSRNAPGSNFRFLSQGVTLATHMSVLILLPRLRVWPNAGAAPGSKDIAAVAATAPPIRPTASRRVIRLKNSRRAESMDPSPVGSGPNPGYGHTLSEHRPLRTEILSAFRGSAPRRRTGVPACGFLRPLPDAPYRPAPLRAAPQAPAGEELSGRGETGWMARTQGGRGPQRGWMPREDSRPTEDNARRPVSPRPAPS